MLYNNNDLMTNSAIKALDFGGKHLDTGRWPKTNIQVSPRVGFTWDVFGDRSLKVRGGTGLFAGRLPLVYMTNMPSNAAMFQHLSVLSTQYNSDGTIKARNAGLDQFAASANGGKFPTTVEDILQKLNQIDANKNPIDISPEKGALQSTVNGVDPNFKMPQIWKTSLGIDWQIPVGFPLTLTLEGTFNKTINGTQVVNWNTKDNASWSQWTGSDNRHMYPADAYYTGTPAYVPGLEVAERATVTGLLWPSPFSTSTAIHSGVVTTQSRVAVSETAWEPPSVPKVKVSGVTVTLAGPSSSCSWQETSARAPARNAKKKDLIFIYSWI